MKRHMTSRQTSPRPQRPRHMFVAPDIAPPIADLEEVAASLDHLWATSRQIYGADVLCHPPHLRFPLPRVTLGQAYVTGRDALQSLIPIVRRDLRLEQGMEQARLMLQASQARCQHALADGDVDRAAEYAAQVTRWQDAADILARVRADRPVADSHALALARREVAHLKKSRGARRHR